MVWSPTSNLLLYGQTADVVAARAAGVRIGLGADWSTSGSRNLLGELRVARAVAGDRLSPRQLVGMVTCDAASILGWSKQLGAIEKGKLADLIVLSTTAGDPFDALGGADEGDISLVIIDGSPRAGTEEFFSHLGVAGETVRFGSFKRVVALGDAAAYPGAPFVGFGEAEAAVRKALVELPEIARAIEATGKGAPARSLDGAAEWFLDLDDLVGPDTAHRMKTGATFDRNPATLLSDVVRPMQLDPVTIAGDKGYWAALLAQRNLPAEVRDRLAGDHNLQGKKWRAES